MVPGQDVTTRTERLPDGCVVERTVRVAPAGDVLHGAFRVTSPDDQVLVEGAFEDGERDGRWSWRYEDGKTRARGAFVRGERKRKWSFRHPDGEKLAEGEYADGHRDGEWTCYDADGEKVALESGEYGFLEVDHPSGGPRARGPLLDRAMHGLWTFWWPNGNKQLEAEFARGERAGEWRFWHEDGTPDPEMAGGPYGSPSPYARLEGELLFLDDAPPVAPGELGEPGTPGARELAALASLPRHPDCPTELGPALRAAVDRLAGPQTGERAEAEKTLIAAEVFALAPLLNRLTGLDLSDPQDAELAAHVNADVLPALCGHTEDWRPGTDAEAVGANRLTLLRWRSFYLLTHASDEYWALDVPCARRKPSARTSLPPFAGERLVAAPREAAAYDAYGGRFAWLADEGEREETEREALDRALEWLVAHQSPDGRWSAKEFAEQCGAVGEGTCPDPGEGAIVDVGVTGLALLALLGDGNTTRVGPHQRALLRGMRWLLAQQDPQTGLIGREVGHHFLYSHAVATYALAEALDFSDSAALRGATGRAVDYCLRARNPTLAWRYDAPPKGENDTSVTAWMVCALKAAERAGVAVDSKAFDGALRWIEHATDSASGRTGYDSTGSISARVTGINDRFPPQKGEAMTAAALWCRFLLGQTPAGSDIMTKNADLILQSLPEWEPGVGCDMYFWFYASQALFQMGDPFWKAWWPAIEETAIEAQREDGDRAGSWDAAGPWGYSGGRVYATALMALCLEAPRRYARFVPEEPRSRSRRRR